MTLIAYLVVLSLVLFTCFILYVISVFGIPGSLSMTTYCFERKKYRGAKAIFPIFILSICSSLLPAWIITSRNLQQCPQSISWIIGIVPVSLAIVCLTPFYYRNSKVKFIHYTAASMCFVAGAIWIFYNCFQLVFMDAVIMIIFLVMAILTHSFRKSKIFWLELAVAYCVMINILALNLTY